MPVRFSSRLRTRRGSLVGIAPQFVALGSGSASNPVFTGPLVSALQQFEATGVGSFNSGSVDGNDGLIVSNYASYDPDAAQVISLDVNSTIPNWGTYGGGNITYANESWWNGTAPVAKMFPPTIADAGSGFGSIDFWKNASKVVRQMNIRWEYQLSSAFCANSVNHPKFIIVRSYANFNTGDQPSYRPMMFLENMQESGNPTIDIDDTLFLCVAQNTFRMFSSTNIVPGPTTADIVDGGPTGPATYCSMRQPFYHAATSGADGVGNPILPVSEIVCLEMRINTQATTDEPNGVVAFRLYRRNGQTFERGIAWTYHPGYPMETYIADIDMFGGGYFNGANPSDPNLWSKMGRRITLGFNYQPLVGRAWIGPPTGFVT